MLIVSIPTATGQDYKNYVTSYMQDERCRHRRSLTVVVLCPAGSDGALLRQDHKLTKRRGKKLGRGKLGLMHWSRATQESRVLFGFPDLFRIGGDVAGDPRQESGF